MKRLLFLILYLSSCTAETRQDIGEGLKAVAPVARVAPGPFGEIAYWVLMGAGTLLAGAGSIKAGKHVHRKLTSTEIVIPHHLKNPTTFEVKPPK